MLAAPAVSCAKSAQVNAHEHTGTVGALRHSLRNGLTAYAVLSPATNSSCHRRLRIKALRDPVGSVGLRRLGTSNGCRDHMVLPYAKTPFVLRARAIAHGFTPRLATAMARQRSRVHHIPSRVRDDARSAPLVGTGRHHQSGDLGRIGNGIFLRGGLDHPNQLEIAQQFSLYAQ